MSDLVLKYLIEYQKEYERRIYLVASENSPSISMRLSYISDIMNRYFFSKEESAYAMFPGRDYLERVYERCVQLLKIKTGAKFVNIKPISGINAMTIALAALTKADDTIAIIEPRYGGHPITRALASRLGLKTLYLPYDRNNFSLDEEQLKRIFAKNVIKLLYIDQSNVLFPIRVDTLAEIIPDIAKIYYDGSHLLGLIFGGEVVNPLYQGASFLGGSTHKTIPGPPKAFIATNNEDDYNRINASSRMFVSHDHAGDIAALTIVLEEMEGAWEYYAKQTIKNAQYFAQELNRRGFSVVASTKGYTQTHQIFVDTNPYFKNAYLSAQILAKCNIIVNAIQGFDDGSSVLRIGTQELTYLGANEHHFLELAKIFEDICIIRKTSIADIKERVYFLRKELSRPLSHDSIERIEAFLRSILIGSAHL